MIQDWDQKRVIAAISGIVLANMDRACAFAAEQAQARAPVMTGRLKASIRYEVQARGTTVEGRVGVPMKEFWGWYQEMGTVKMAARPFLRPAVFGNAERIVRMIEGKE